MALYVKGKVSTTYAVLGLGYGGGIVPACHLPAIARAQASFRFSGIRKPELGSGREGCQAQGGTSLQRWNLLAVVSFLAKSG